MRRCPLRRRSRRHTRRPCSRSSTPSTALPEMKEEAMAVEHVAVDGAELHVEVVGEGRTLVLVHGLGLSGALWNRMRGTLGAGKRLVLVDLRGAGRSRELEASELSLARWAQDLGAVVRELGLEHPAV